MKFSQVKICRICDCPSLEKVIDFGCQALSTRFPRLDQDDAPYLPLALMMCATCKLVQLSHDFDLDDLYRGSYGYRSGINDTMTTHLTNIVRQVEKTLHLNPKDVVLDIASNDATLLKQYKNSEITRVGIDPTISIYSDYYGQDYKTAADFFNLQTYQALVGDEKAKVITSIAVFYDVPNPRDFVSDIKQILHDDGIWVFEQSYLPLLLKNLAFESICHEHVAYYCVSQLERLLSQKQLRIFSLQTNDMNGGSVRVFACHQEAAYQTNFNEIRQLKRLEDDVKVNAFSTYYEFMKKINLIGNLILNYLKKLEGQGEKVYVYGASTKGNVLLQTFKIDNKLIVGAAERNPNKFGCRTPGTNITIVPEDEARMDADYFFVLPWHFKDEFLHREKKYIEAGGKLFFPLPVPTIVSKDGQFLIAE